MAIDTFSLLVADGLIAVERQNAGVILAHEFCDEVMPFAGIEVTIPTWRQELLGEAEELIEREPFEPPDASNLSRAARERWAVG